MKDYFAVVALVVSVGANIPYIIDIYKGRARPERISWLLWMLLGLTYYFSAVFSDGAAWFALGELIGPGMIFVLALKFGVGGKSILDRYSLTVAIIALSLVFVFNDVLIGLLLALTVDAIGAMLTLRKLLIDPTSESRSFWGLGVISAGLALLSLKTYNVQTMLFPCYVLLFSSLVLIISKPAKNTHPKELENL